MIILPRELNLGGVYVPSLLVAGAVAVVLAYLLLLLLSRLGIIRYFYHVMLVYVGIAVILTVVLDVLLRMLW